MTSDRIAGLREAAEICDSYGERFCSDKIFDRIAEIRAELEAEPKAAEPVAWIREPSKDRRIGHGDDFAGDAWRDPVTGAIRYVVVGCDPRTSESKVDPMSAPPQPASQDVAELVKLLRAVMINRRHCFLPETGTAPEALLNWTNRAEAALAKYEGKV